MRRAILALGGLALVVAVWTAPRYVHSPSGIVNVAAFPPEVIETLRSQYPVRPDPANLAVRVLTVAGLTAVAYALVPEKHPRSP